MLPPQRPTTDPRVAGLTAEHLSPRAEMLQTEIRYLQFQLARAHWNSRKRAALQQRIEELLAQLQRHAYREVEPA